ncbi:hypothetical protein BOX15_Mlig028144g1, partial [Macrostomum lignano]
ILKSSNSKSVNPAMRVLLLLSAAALAASAAPGTQMDTWVELQCLEIQEKDLSRHRGKSPDWLLLLPVVRGLTCRARGHVTFEEPGPELAWMEFDIASPGCIELFYCSDEFVRVSLRDAGNRTFAGLSTAWDTKISDCDGPGVAPHGRKNCFWIGDRWVLHMAYMLRPAALLPWTD